MKKVQDFVGLEAEHKRLIAEIAALSPKSGPKLPGRAVPSGSSAKLVALNRQLATIALKLRLGKLKAK